MKDPQEKKVTKENIVMDDIMIQSSMIMVNAIHENKAEGANLKFQAMLDDQPYDVDIIIKKPEVI